MRCFLLFCVIFFMVSVSVSYHIRNQDSENTILSSSDVIPTSTVETTLNNPIWNDFSINTTTNSSFTESSDTSTDSITTDFETTLDTEIWDEFSTFGTEISSFTETSDIPTDSMFESNTEKSIEVLAYKGFIILIHLDIKLQSSGVFPTTATNFTTSVNSFNVTDISKKLENSTKEPEIVFTIFSSTATNFTTSVNSSNVTDMSKELGNSSIEPEIVITRRTAANFKNSTAASESSTANSGNLWNNTTKVVKSTLDVMEMINRPSLNTIETETSELKKAKCGQRFSRIPRIIGGIRSLAGEFPWMVSVRVLTSHFCGGVIINKDWILTAGHCVRRFAARYWRIRLGGQDVNIDQFRPQWDIPVSKIVLHPKFGAPARYSNDIALLKLQRSIKSTDFAAPICLPENLRETFDGVNATVVGWGRTNENVEEKTPFLQKAFIPVINNSLCAEWYRKVHYGYIRVRDYQICAGLREGGRDACKGDSGGPLVMEDNGQYTLLGITSAGVGCGRSELPGIYSRATHFVPWILKITGGYTLWPLDEDYEDYYH